MHYGYVITSDGHGTSNACGEKRMGFNASFVMYLIE